MATIPIRQTLEQRGYKVDYDPKTKNIVVSDPSTGRTGTIYSGSYTTSNGVASINPSALGSWLSSPASTSVAPASQPYTQSINDPNTGIAAVARALKSAEGNPAMFQYVVDTINQNYGTGWQKPETVQNIAGHVMPQMPTFNIAAYAPPSLPTIDLSQATAQARGEIDPATRVMQERTNRIFQEQLERLPQILNASGRSLSGGSRIVGERNLAQEKARQLSDIETQQEAKIMELARGIMERNAEQVRQQQQQAYQEWLGQQQLAMQKYQADLAQWNAIQNAVNKAAAQLLAQRQWEEEQAWEKEKWGKELEQAARQQAFEEQKWAQEWPYKVKQYQYELNKPYYAPSKASGGSSKGSGGTLTERTRNALADAYEAVDKAIANGYSKDDIKETIISETANLARQGIDVNKVLAYLDSKKTAEELQQEAIANAKAALDLRPWWQKAIDTVIPGAQYR